MAESEVKKGMHYAGKKKGKKGNRQIENEREDKR